MRNGPIVHNTQLICVVACQPDFHEMKESKMIRGIRLWLSTIALTVIAGCAGTPYRLAISSPSELKSATDYDLCASYSYNQSENVLRELESREIVQPSFEADVNAHVIRVGMNACEMVAARGRPTRINKTSTAEGDSVQY